MGQDCGVGEVAFFGTTCFFCSVILTLTGTGSATIFQLLFALASATGLLNCADIKYAVSGLSIGHRAWSYRRCNSRQMWQTALLMTPSRSRKSCAFRDTPSHHYCSSFIMMSRYSSAAGVFANCVSGLDRPVYHLQEQGHMVPRPQLLLGVDDDAEHCDRLQCRSSHPGGDIGAGAGDRLRGAPCRFRPSGHLGVQEQARSSHLLNRPPINGLCSR